MRGELDWAGIGLRKGLKIRLPRLIFSAELESAGLGRHALYRLLKEVNMEMHKPSTPYRTLLSGIAVALILGGCASLADRPPTDPEAAGPGCQPITETEIHAPGDSHWIGHDVRQLQQVLGKEAMRLGKPSENLVLVYERVGEDCVDAYVIDNCNKVIDYFCRPLPVSPMKWDRSSPIPESD
jgi:hypothetical protein